MAAPEEPQNTSEAESSETPRETESFVDRLDAEDINYPYDDPIRTEKAEKKPPAPIEIFIKQDANGSVEAHALISLKPSDELLEQIAGWGLKNPHYVVLVTAIHSYDHYGNGAGDEYSQTSAYIQPLNRPYADVTFAKAGRNRVDVTVVDIQSRDKEKWAYKVRNNAMTLIDYFGEFVTDPWSWKQEGHYGQGNREVLVPKEMFSEPAKWKVNLVSQFWRGRNVDDCDLRKKLWFGAFPLALLVQTYGLVVRPLLFVLALIMLKREIRPKQFFGAFWPHHGWQSSGESVWFTDKDGNDRRKSIVPFLSPPALALIGLVFFGLPWLYYELYGKAGESYWTYFVFGLVMVAIVLVSFAVIFAGISGVARLIKRTRRPRHEETEEERWARLRSSVASVSENPDWDTVPENQRTVRLRFAHVKAKVCRPIAR